MGLGGNTNLIQAGFRLGIEELSQWSLGHVSTEVIMFLLHLHKVNFHKPVKKKKKPTFECM